MKVTLFKSSPEIYSAQAYFVQGSWNAISDVNTMIDTGRDDNIVNDIYKLHTGVGKRRLELVILTHEHFDHSASLKVLKKEFNPRVIAMAKNPFVDEFAYDGMKVKIGDSQAEIIHTPGHSNDSICIYVPDGGVLFSGDTLLNIKTINGTYTRDYIEALEKLASLDIKIIYSGHDDPIDSKIKELFENSLNNVKKSKIFN